MSAATIIRIPEGAFVMGSASFYPEEQPAHELTIPEFWIDATPVTNQQFASFVAETGYVTVAERPVPAGLGTGDPGSLVFTPTTGPVDLRDWRQWWRWVPGASWRAPQGPGSNLAGLDRHPVVHVAYADAIGYAAWAGKRLPTEAEHEYAAGGGATPAPYAWGQERDPGGTFMANTWRGHFPYENTADDGWTRTSQVGAFPANGHGLFDMIGNVWEWTSSLFTSSHTAQPPRCSCSPAREIGAWTEATTRVLKGGSHLCAPEYCLRYRPAARSPQAEDTASSHIGFRCASTNPPAWQHPSSRHRGESNAT